ncbi:MAG: hypothetical protein M3463_12845, partial [Verrucomicrobiota bacterium]|nr:hypothetical protein [Verrucomicrobiota bacterium]
FRNQATPAGGMLSPIVTGGTHDWQELSTVIQAPEAATDLLISLNKATDDGIAYFTDIKVGPATEPVVSAAEMSQAAIRRLFPLASADQDPAAVTQAALALGRQKSPESLVLATDGKAACRIYAGSEDVIATRTFKRPAGSTLKSLTVRALHCEQLPGAGSGMWTHGLDVALPAKPVKNFTYRFWVKSESSSQSYRLGLQFLKPNNTASPLQESDYLRAGSGWTQISADFTSLVNARISEGYTRLSSITQRPYNPGGNVPYFVSDVSVQMTDEAPKTLYASDLESGTSVYGGTVATVVEQNASRDGVYRINDGVNPPIMGVMTGKPAPVATGWKRPSSTVTIGMSKGWYGAVGEITYGGGDKPDATYRFEDMTENAPLNGVHGGIDFGTGQWVSRSSFHAGCFDDRARPQSIEFHAAQKLSKYLGQITGASFEPFAHDANPAAAPLLIVGRNNISPINWRPASPTTSWARMGSSFAPSGRM